MFFLKISFSQENSFSKEEIPVSSGISLNYGYFNKQETNHLFLSTLGIRGNLGHESRFFGGYFFLDYFQGKLRVENESIKCFTSGIELRLFLKKFFIFFEAGKFILQESNLNEKGLYEFHESWMRGGGIGYKFKIKQSFGEIIIRSTSTNSILLSDFDIASDFGRNLISFGIFF